METYLTQITNYLLTQSWQIAILVVVIAAVNSGCCNSSSKLGAEKQERIRSLFALADCLS